ncbi:putative membrane protein [Halopelagius inordinatus]|uniref:Putative membrane protein n=1 Tax=Halopelagius inordinatus TaxID=553467 RepID=A0A1I2PER8_9EURY|nr:SHOCT domain-containing protein [Halopelagius inordinatus]SFG14652.1 putative membrane protein [Halopelagius inordinatus]
MPEHTDDRRLVTIALVVGAIVLLPVFLVGFGMLGFGSMMGGTWGGGMRGTGAMPGWVLVGIVVRILLLAALVAGGYLLYRAVTGGETDSDQALEELRLAYARGELTDDEYETRREALERDTKSRSD